MKTAIGILLVGLWACAAPAQRAGDVALIAYNSDSDEFAWVALCDLPPNTPIHFTDSSARDGWFHWAEHLGRAVAPGPLSWCSAEALPAGTVVTWSGTNKACWNIGAGSGGAPMLNADGDQLVAYVGSVVSNAAGGDPWWGDPAGATVLHALNFANTGWSNVTSATTTWSDVPPGVRADRHTAVHVGRRDNGYYAGPRTGTAEALLVALSMTGHWTTADAWIDPTNWPASFTVRGTTQGTMLSVW
jgi:hypothetical protein